MLTHKSYSFHIFEDKNESFQSAHIFSRFEINEIVKVLLWEFQKYFLWNEKKCLSSPFYCIAKYHSAVDFYAKFQHVIIEIPVYSEEFCSVSEEILNIMKLFFSCRRAME